MVSRVTRLFLVVWLALFAVQTSDLVAAVAPDGCTEYSTRSGSDPCPDGCARCVCCARVAVFVPQGMDAVASGPRSDIPVPPSIDRISSAEPRGILHVPKTR